MPEIDHVELSMKPMLADCVKEAVRLALVDACWPVDEQKGTDRAESWTDAERLEFRRNIHALPSSALSKMDPEALAQNVAVRLLGTGGWVLPDPRGGVPIYTGNATTREVFDATFERPDRSIVDEMAFDLGLQPADEGEDSHAS